MNQHKEILLGWVYLLETSSFTGWTRLKSNCFILHKVPVIGSCQMDKYCNGSVASLACTLITCSTSIRLFSPPGEGCCKQLTETHVRLCQISRVVFLAQVLAANRTPGSLGPGCKSWTEKRLFSLFSDGFESP